MPWFEIATQGWMLSSIPNNIHRLPDDIYLIQLLQTYWSCVGSKISCKLNIYIDSLIIHILTISTVSHFHSALFWLSKCGTLKMAFHWSAKTQQLEHTWRPLPRPRCFYTSGTVALLKSALLKVQAADKVRQEMAATWLHGQCPCSVSVKW